VTPSGGRPLARFSVLDLKILADFGADDAATLDALVAEGVIEQHEGETK
jgi:hypothetical protein